MASKTHTPASAELNTEEQLRAELARLQAELAATKAKAADPKHPALSDEEAAWVLANARPAEAACLCGCGGVTKGRFVPGHDAVLKSRLARTAAQDTGQTDGPDAAWDAHASLVVFGW
jgi:hypothetical protein